MSKTGLLRLAIWASAVLAALFQTAFLFELHSPAPSELVLWSFSILSIACVVVVLFIGRSSTARAKIGYGPERVYRQHHFRGPQYGVQGVYCVVLGHQPSVPPHIPRTKCLYLSEDSADRAVTTASIENPQWRAIGVEPPNLSTRKPQSDRSRFTSHTSHVA
jgi:hypothetical protein